MSLQTQPAAPLPSQAGGRLTLPIQTGMDEEVRRLIARLGADSAHVLAVGDGSNDVEMIEWAGAGVVMGSAPQWVRDRGDILTEPVWRDGCAAVLDAVIERVRHP